MFLLYLVIFPAIPRTAFGFVPSYLYELFFCAAPNGGRFGEFVRNTASRQFLVSSDTVVCIGSEKHNERTHRRSTRTLRTNPPSFGKTQRTNPPGFGKNATNEPTRVHENATNEPAAAACLAKIRRSKPSSRAAGGLCGTRRNEAISRNPLVRTRSLPARSDDRSFLRNEANHQIWGPHHGRRPPTKRAERTHRRKRAERTHGPKDGHRGKRDEQTHRASGQNAKTGQVNRASIGGLTGLPGVVSIEATWPGIS
jgi:hypothetical protein